MQKKLSLSFELAPNLPQYILTDEGKLRQVLINILGNAIKFTNTGGVTLRVSFFNGQNNDQGQMTINFEIEDTGAGIAAEELDNLFQPFVQTASGTKIREGTGLGLTISRQFVQLMGGDIRLHSQVGCGSTFDFDIKIELAESFEIAPPRVQNKAIALANGQPVYRILVVDDRQENCDLLTQLLNSIGFETRAAANGIEAIAAWQAWHPHLIWMDMRMPLMDGYEATRQIRAIEREIQKGELEEISPLTVIIALTASAFEEQRSSILAAGCDDLIRKPFREEVILNKMAELLGVCYVYAEEQDNFDQTPLVVSELEELKTQDLFIMPQEWRTSLHEAAIQVDAEIIFQLIEQIPETNFALSERLSDLVNRFCFDEIIDLTQRGDDA
ncbi:MAG: ATP-binding protein [Nostoc sp.]|uniref:ATP-binding protein n=1 Tax=Nostoc sp. TaxID=1180 RepID=UPI002FF6993D